MPVSLTRVVAFEARHRYYVAGWADADNRARFGALSESHPHEYRCEVTVRGPLEPVTGMIVDLAELDAILRQEVLGPFGGQDLNQAIPEVASGATQPTCEVLAGHLYRRIAARLPTGVVLERVRLAEDSTLHADCTGTT